MNHATATAYILPEHIFHQHAADLTCFSACLAGCDTIRQLLLPDDRSNVLVGRCCCLVLLTSPACLTAYLAQQMSPALT